MDRIFDGAADKLLASLVSAILPIVVPARLRGRLRSMPDAVSSMDALRGYVAASVLHRLLRAAIFHAPIYPRIVDPSSRFSLSAVRVALVPFYAAAPRLP